jgi:GT2 family glycosyltransferase
MATLDIVIVNWNTGRQLRSCLESIASTRRDGVELMRVRVVDNDSRDGSADGLDDLDIPLELLRNGENSGFAAACNQGAKGGTSEYLLFLNPDTFLEGDSLSTPTAFMARAGNERIGVTGIKLVGDDGSPQRACARFPGARHFLSRSLGLDTLFPRRFPSYRMLDWDHEDSRVVDQVTGAFFLVRRRLFEELGGFDERFFVYMEELDFSRRMHASGWKSFYLADAAAYHRGGGASETDRGRRLFYAIRSRIVYAIKHFGGPQSAVLVTAALVVEPVIRIAAAVAHGSAGRAGETVRAYFLLWKELPRILKGTHPSGGVV